MASVEELQRAILSLDPAQAAALADWVVAAVPRTRVVAPGIEVDPRVCGGDPCIVGTRIPVWSLEEYRRMGVNNERMLECYPSLTLDDLNHAWNYVAAHREEVDRMILENQMA